MTIHYVDVMPVRASVFGPFQLIFELGEITSEDGWGNAEGERHWPYLMRANADLSARLTIPIAGSRA